VAAPLNSELIITALLRQARAKPDAMAWLMELHTAATEAVLRGDEYVTGTGFKGQTMEALRDMPATTLLQILEVALQRYEAEDAADTTQSIMGGTDFSRSYTRC
jgi:hypothetical protein